MTATPPSSLSLTGMKPLSSTIFLLIFYQLRAHDNTLILSGLFLFPFLLTDKWRGPTPPKKVFRIALGLTLYGLVFWTKPFNARIAALNVWYFLSCTGSVYHLAFSVGSADSLASNLSVLLGVLSLATPLRYVKNAWLSGKIYSRLPRNSDPRSSVVIALEVGCAPDQHKKICATCQT